MKNKKDKIYYFQEKSNDILDLQDELTAEEIGIYFILKAGYFKYAGELKKENANQRCKFFGDINKFNLMINKLFDDSNGLLVNNSWLSEINDIKKLSEKRKAIAKSRWSGDISGGKQKVANASKSKQKVANLADSDSKNKSESESKKESGNELPIFINKNLFDDFVKMRIKIKKPMTEEAIRLLLKKLTRFEEKQAGFANQALEDSITSSYQGVFEPRAVAPSQNQFKTKQQLQQEKDTEIYSNLMAKYGNNGGNNA